MPAAGAENTLSVAKAGGTRFAIRRSDMTPREIELVQGTWKSVLPIRDTFAEIFYGKLFSLDGALQRHFAGDMKEQGRSFAAMMSIYIRNLAEPEKVEIALQGLGRRHAAYGVTQRDYETLSVALFWALSHALGEAFTGDAEAAWRSAWRRLTEAMRP